MVAYAVLVERKISAWIQDRVGPEPHRAAVDSKIPIIGPFLTRLGIFQPIADGLKFMLKEDFTPALRAQSLLLACAGHHDDSGVAGAGGDSVRLEPRRSEKMVIARPRTSAFSTRSVSCRSAVYGIVLAGYASNSKYPFLGGIRSSAQMISYEIAMGMSASSRSS